MKLRAPLYLKIAGWLCANLLLVALGLGGFVAVQYHLGLDSLLAGRAGDRVAAVAGVIAAELRTLPRERWDATLAPFSESYGVKFLLYAENGEHLAGDATELPAPVRARVTGPGPRPPGEPPREGGPPRHPHPPRPTGEPEAGHPPPPLPDRGVEPPPPPAGRPVMVRTADPARYWVLVRLPVRASPPDRPGEGPRPPPGLPVTLVAVSDSLAGGGLFFEWTPWLLAAALVLAVSVLCWLPLVRGLTRAVWRLTEATGRIAEGRFDVRVTEESRGDELGALADSINRMAARLDGFVTGQKRFLGDIAHELCAPLARLQMAAGILEQRATADTRANVEDLREEIEHMSALVEELLSFTKASLAPGGRGAPLTNVELREVVARAARREGADEATVRNEVPAGLAVRADAELLARAVANLLRNSLRHAAGTGPITVAVGPASGDAVRLIVRDRGPGVPAESLARLFEPFYRPDPSRDRATGGVGLGLAIVKTCVEACGGTVAARNAEGGGFEVTLALPAAGQV